jgi:sigma-E factor negative regulatory protein RseA
MQDDKKEWLSALVDNHADLKDLDQVINNEQNRQTWSRYHLIGDVMRGDTAEKLDLDLVNNIEAALDKEPVLVSLAAHRSWRERIMQSKVVQNSSKYVGQVTQFAIAATVAFVTVFSVQQYQQSEDEYSPLPVFQATGTVSGTISPVSLSNNPEVVDKREVQRDMLLQQQRINALLFDHQQQLKLNGSALTEADK